MKNSYDSFYIHVYSTDFFDKALSDRLCIPIDVNNSTIKCCNLIAFSCVHIIVMILRDLLNFPSSLLFYIDLPNLWQSMIIIFTLRNLIYTLMQISYSVHMYFRKKRFWESAASTLVEALTLAPRLRSSVTTATWPSFDARCSALSPFCKQKTTQ